MPVTTPIRPYCAPFPNPKPRCTTQTPRDTLHPLYMSPPSTPSPADFDPLASPGAAIAGLRSLRRFHEGVVSLHERTADIRFVFESTTGQIIMPVEQGMAKSGQDMTLWMPAESQWLLHAALIPRLIDRPESVEAVDRWAAYHGKSSLTFWIRCEIDGLKSRDGGPAGVFTQEQVQLPNEFGRAEYPLIRRCNSDITTLSLAIKRHAAMSVLDPLCVGVDGLGLDIRARFGIIRLEFPEGVHVRTPAQAEAQIDHLLGRTGVC